MTTRCPYSLKVSYLPLSIYLHVPPPSRASISRALGADSMICLCMGEAGSVRELMVLEAALGQHGLGFGGKIPPDCSPFRWETLRYAQHSPVVPSSSLHTRHLAP